MRPEDLGVHALFDCLNLGGRGGYFTVRPMDLVVRAEARWAGFADHDVAAGGGVGPGVGDALEFGAGRGLVAGERATPTDPVSAEHILTGAALGAEAPVGLALFRWFAARWNGSLR